MPHKNLVFLARELALDYPAGYKCFDHTSLTQATPQKSTLSFSQFEAVALKGMERFCDDFCPYVSGGTSLVSAH